MKKRGVVSKPAVLGAIIQLGQCMDLLDVKMTRQLHEVLPFYQQRLKAENHPVPLNDPSKKRHGLDCAFLNWAIPLLEEDAGTSYHTVRGVFVEGKPIYPTAQIHSQSHIQLAVRQPSAIIGYFLPARF